MTSTLLESTRGTDGKLHKLEHITELDGVRGIAALVVFFHHLCFMSIDPTHWGWPVVALFHLFSYGNSGVDLFFCLSGFLITSLLIQAREQRRYYKDFYWKRTLRILPLYLVCLLGVMLFIPGSKTYVLLSLLFLANFAHLLHYTTPGPFWTLAIEEHFYLLWPTVVRRRQIDQIRHWALAVALIAIVLRFGAACTGHFNYRLTFLRCDGLALGALVACWFTRDGKQNPLRDRRTIPLGFTAGIVSVVISLFFQGPVLRTMAFRAAFLQLGISVISASIIAYLVSKPGRQSARWLRQPLLLFFGTISYAMYMTHMYVMMVYDRYVGLPAAGMYLAYTTRILAVLAATIAVCLVSRYLIELPAASLRKYVLTKHS